MKNKELLFSVKKGEFEWKTFQAGGKGGQHQNKTDSGVRVRHLPSGAVGESRDERSQHRNKRIALKRLIKTRAFRLWSHRVACEKIGILESIEKAVDREMKNVRVEVRDEHGRWWDEGHK